MPPKTSAGRRREKTKDEVADKVKEIKQKQENWMKQRASKNSGDVPKKNLTSQSPATPDTKHALKQAELAASTTNAANISSSPAPRNAQFRSWLTTRKKSSNKEGLDTEKIKAGVGVTQVLSASPGYDDDDSSASTESDVTLPSALGCDSAASERMTSQCDMTSTDISHTEQYKPIPPDQFDDLADRIANKVKRDLCLDKDTFSSHRSPVGHFRYPRDNTENKHFTTHHNTGKQQESQFTNHSCPQCSNLMASSETCPMLLIPCGHTVCCQCAQSSCPQCGVNISSVTPNLMLQQIIMSHNQGNPRKTGTHASGSRCTGPKLHDNDYLPNKYEDYAEECGSLVLRCEVLEEETRSVNATIDKIQEHIWKQERQIANIGTAEAGILEEMAVLEKKLDQLRQHKYDYAKQCEQLEKDKDKQTASLNVIQATLRDLYARKKHLQQLSEEGHR